MKIGLSSYTFPWAVGVPGWPPTSPLGPVALLRTAAELGVGVVQFADNLPLDELDEQQLSAVEAVGTTGLCVMHLRARRCGCCSTMTKCWKRFPCTPGTIGWTSSSPRPA